MADDNHVAQLRKGVAAWNAWCKENRDIRPDLSEANLTGVDLSGANLSNADLNAAFLSGANLSGANLNNVDLRAAALLETNLTGADLTGCRIYGVSAWDLKVEGAKQQNLVITPENEPEITVDNIEVAQFVYLLRVAVGPVH